MLPDELWNGKVSAPSNTRATAANSTYRHIERPPLNRGGLNSTHIHGTDVPVEEPSTASKADVQRHGVPDLLRSTFDFWLFLQNHVQQETVDPNFSVVVNQTQPTKFVHEKVYT
jgi:hypothetical protein